MVDQTEHTDERSVKRHIRRSRQRDLRRSIPKLYAPIARHPDWPVALQQPATHNLLLARVMRSLSSAQHR